MFAPAIIELFVFEFNRLINTFPFFRVIKLKSTVSVLREEKYGADGNRLAPDGPDASALHVRKEKSRTRGGGDDGDKDKKDKKKR